MRVNTAIGEASAEIGGQTYTVRPSFAAIASLGGPEDIDSVIRGCFSAIETFSNGMVPRLLHLCCCSVMLEACSNIPTEVLGWAEPVKNSDRLIWRQRLVSVDDLVVMANHCVKWGVMGDPRQKLSKSKKQRASGLFDPQAFVAVMIEEFGASRSDAWDTTMTEFQRLCEHRQDKAWGDRPKPPTKEEAIAAAEHAERAYAQAVANGTIKKHPAKNRRR